MPSALHAPVAPGPVDAKVSRMTVFAFLLLVAVGFCIGFTHPKAANNYAGLAIPRALRPLARTIYAFPRDRFADFDVPQSPQSPLLPEGPSPGVITSRKNPLAKRVRALHDAKGRKEAGLLLLEGTHMLDECLKRGLEVDCVIATPKWQALNQHTLDTLHPDVPIYFVTPDVLDSMATTVTPDGVLVLIPPPYASRPVARTLVLALDCVQDPGNLGTLLRTAAATDVEQVWLGGGADPYQPKVLRAAAGAALSLPIQRADDLALRLEAAREAGMQVVAAVVGAPTPYWEVDWTLPTVVLLGSEGRGVDPALLAPGDRKVRIPHSPTVESLNVAVAAGVLLFERRRQLGTEDG